MVSDGTNFSEFVPSKADGVRDYNDSGRNIRVGFAGSSLGLGNSDAEQNVKYAASANYATNAGSASSASYATKAGSADNEYCIMVQSAQPTDSRCKLWIKI